MILFFLVSTLSASEKSLITGDRFKERCRYCFDENGFHINPCRDNNWWFVKSDFIDRFFEEKLPQDPFILITHNSDRGVEDRHLPYLDCPQLIHWYGQNINTRHPKLSAIPIGLCNFGPLSTLNAIRQKQYAKTRLVYACYRTGTNEDERRACEKKTRVPNLKRRPARTYLKEMAESYFVISPNGNGIDTHRTWEALYLRAIPIVTRSPTTEHFAHLPILILDSWDDFQELELSPELYEELWDHFDPDSLSVEAFLPA